MKKYLTNKAFFAAILVAGIFAISQIPSNVAMANGNNDQIPSSVTIPLEGLTLKAGQFIELTDTTPVLVTAAHATINVPCDNGNNNNDPESDKAAVDHFIEMESNSLAEVDIEEFLKDYISALFIFDSRCFILKQEPL